MISLMVSVFCFLVAMVCFMIVATDSNAPLWAKWLTGLMTCVQGPLVVLNLWCLIHLT